MPALADFIGDSHARLELRNHYINRDFRQDNAPQAKAEEWGQGFTARWSRALPTARSALASTPWASWASSSTPAATVATPACCPSARTAMNRSTTTASWA
jgi:hypothetical protein